MMGKRPYLGRSRKEIRDNILAKQVQLKRSEIPSGWSLEAADFINRVFISKKRKNDYFVEVSCFKGSLRTV